MGRSPGFGSTLTDMPHGSALLRLGFPAAPGLQTLNLPANVTRRFILQKARRHPVPRDIGLRLLVGDWFQVLFHSPPGVLFTFPSRYWFTIGHHRYLALDGGPPDFPRNFTCSVVLTNSCRRHPSFHLRDCHPLWWPVPGSFCYDGAL